LNILKTNYRHPSNRPVNSAPSNLQLAGHKATYYQGANVCSDIEADGAAMDEERCPNPNPNPNPNWMVQPWMKNGAFVCVGFTLSPES